MSAPLPAGTTREGGRELDLRVAVEVMGYVWWRDGDYALLRVPGTNWAAAEMNRGELTYSLLPEFSTNIAAAWLVVEKLIQTGHFPDLITTWADGGLKWKCVIDRYTNPDDALDPYPVRARADTAPLAICLAALSALTPTPTEPA